MYLFCRNLELKTAKIVLFVKVSSVKILINVHYFTCLMQLYRKDHLL